MKFLCHAIHSWTTLWSETVRIYIISPAICQQGNKCTHAVYHALTFLSSKWRIPEAICIAIIISCRSFSSQLTFSYLFRSPKLGSIRLDFNKLSRVPPGINSVTTSIFSNKSREGITFTFVKYVCTGEHFLCTVKSLSWFSRSVSQILRGDR